MIQLTDARVVAEAERMAIECGCRNAHYHAPVARVIVEMADERSRLTTTTAWL